MVQNLQGPSYEVSSTDITKLFALRLFILAFVISVIVHQQLVAMLRFVNNV